jgi:UDP-N-acetylglucosamine 2-epimerase
MAHPVPVARAFEPFTHRTPTFFLILGDTPEMHVFRVMGKVVEIPLIHQGAGISRTRISRTRGYENGRLSNGSTTVSGTMNT